MGVVKETEVRRGDVFPVSLDPTVGGEIQKARPCVRVSPDVNRRGQTFILRVQRLAFWAPP